MKIAHILESEDLDLLYEYYNELPEDCFLENLTIYN